MQQQQQPTQPNPWNDFFQVYLDLVYALHAEINKSLPNEAKVLEELLQKIRSQDEACTEFNRSIVHDVIKSFKNKSKQILLQDSSYFDDELQLFPSTGIDIAKMWRDHPMFRQSIWQWVEQLYIIGNVC